MHSNEVPQLSMRLSGPHKIVLMQAEEEFTKAAMADTEALQAQLFKELRGRIQEADQTAAIRCIFPTHSIKTRDETHSL